MSHPRKTPPRTTIDEQEISLHATVHLTNQPVIPATPIPAQTATQRPEEAMEPTAPEASIFGLTKPQGPLSIDPSSIVQTPLQTQTQIGS
jgi:hypothetical protein